MVQESLIQALKEEGVEEVATDVFDPNLHMAIQTVPATDDCPAEHIAQVFQKGYKLHERLLRPAMVVVSEQSLCYFPKKKPDRNVVKLLEKKVN